MRKTSSVLLILAAGMVIAAGCAKKSNDPAIATSIKAQMFSDAQLKDSSIQVSVSKGVVTLSGTLPSDAAKYEAYKIAAQTPDVTKVNDETAVQTAEATPPPPPAPEPAPKRRAHHVVRHREVTSNASPAPEAAPAPAPATQPAPAEPPAPQPTTVEIPAGTNLRIQMIDSVDSAINHTGQEFHASLAEPIVIDNKVIVSKGADVYVRLVQASSAGHMTGRSELRLELTRLVFQGTTYPLVSSTYDVAGSSRGKRTAETMGGGAALGAIIGAIAGGGKGAAIGAGVGAASGGVYQGVTHGKQVKIPSETLLDFKLEQPADITYTPGQ